MERKKIVISKKVSFLRLNRAFIKENVMITPNAIAGLEETFVRNSAVVVRFVRFNGKVVLVKKAVKEERKTNARAS